MSGSLQRFLRECGEAAVAVGEMETAEQYAMAAEIVRRITSIPVGSIRHARATVEARAESTGCKKCMVAAAWLDALLSGEPEAECGRAGPPPVERSAEKG